MTGKELLDQLKASGTGAAKLAVGLAALASDPDCSALQIYNAMSAAGVAEGTLAKAREKMGDEAPPPPDLELPAFPIRAPMGGAKIGGKDFLPGQIIPGSLLASATAEEIKSLHGDGQGRVELRPVAPKSR